MPEKLTSGKLKKIKDIYWTLESFENINIKTKWNLADSSTKFSNIMCIKIVFNIPRDDIIFMNYNYAFPNITEKNIILVSTSHDIEYSNLKSIDNFSNIIHCHKFDKSLISDIETYFNNTLKYFWSDNQILLFKKNICNKKNIISLLNSDNQSISCKSIEHPDLNLIYYWG